MQFTPNLSKPTATLIAGKQISNHVYRFRAVVSSLATGWKEALTSCIGKDLKLVPQAAFEVAGKRQDGVGHTVEAFAVYAPTTHFISKSELASTLESLNVRKVAANLYMGDDETVWKVNEAGNNYTITKEGTDDIEALLASANANHYNHDFVSQLNPSGMGEIAFVHDNGTIVAGISVGRVNGDLNRIQALMVDDLQTKGTSAEPIVLSTLQVVAFEEFQDLDEPEEFENFDPLDYWRSVYSNDPEIMRTLETFAEDMNLQA
jgi:hypothetical protein